MTKRKKWPHGAEDARVDAVSLFCDIHTEVREVQRMLGRGLIFEAVIALGGVADTANRGVTILQRAKDAPDANI